MVLLGVPTLDMICFLTLFYLVLMYFIHQVLNVLFSLRSNLVDIFNTILSHGLFQTQGQQNFFKRIHCVYNYSVLSILFCHFQSSKHLQERDQMQTFLETFAYQTSSDGATDAMSTFQTKLQDGLFQAKIAKLYVVEAFIIKALRQHRTAVAANDQSGIQAALTALNKEHSFLTSNKIELTSADACPALWDLAKTTLA